MLMSGRYNPEEKYRIIEYSYKHGINKTLEAISLNTEKINVKNRGNPNLTYPNSTYKNKLSKSTLCRWRRKWKISCEDYSGVTIDSVIVSTFGSKIGKITRLEYISTKPKLFRQSKINPLIITFIKQTRSLRHGIGKDKLKILVDEFVINYNKDKTKLTQITTISISTIGRIIHNLVQRKEILSYNKHKEVYLNGAKGIIKTREIQDKNKKIRLRKPKEHIANYPGDVVQIDAITYYINGTKRYLVCGIDLYTRFAFATSYKQLNSNNAKNFLNQLENIFRYSINHIQTDNGQEYHKYFDEYLKYKNIPHYWNYPRTPKQNAYIERFNRTIQEEFINYNIQTLKQPNLDQFQTKLLEYLRYYNYQRPHHSLQFLTPMQKLKQYQEGRCHM